jgi:hypothetical protein
MLLAMLSLRSQTAAWDPRITLGLAALLIGPVPGEAFIGVGMHGAAGIEARPDFAWAQT